jgi:perosamine synthetase
MDTYRAIAARHEITLIEDCCEALATTYQRRPCGSFGRAGVFGFYPNKQITTGEGGMIVTDDEKLAEMCRSLRNQGRGILPETATAERHNPRQVGTWLRHERLGYNYRMPEINAALGVAQMRRLDDIVMKRQAVADLYVRRLMGNSNLMLPTLLPETSMSWFVFVVRLVAGYTQEERDRVIAGMRNHDVGAADYFPCIHLQPFFREMGYGPGMFPIAEAVSQRTIALPFFNGMTSREVEIVAATLEVMIGRENLRRG